MTNRDSIEFDVLFVGAGPASLAGAYHLSRLIEQHNRNTPGGGLGEVSIAVIEKGKEVNAHSFSGAVLDPRALRELMPDFVERGAPVETPVSRDHVCFLTRQGKLRLPLIPPPLRNHGHYVVSLGRLVGWLAGQCESRDVTILPEFAGAELLFEGGRIVGVRAGDKGVDKRGEPKPNFEPGPDLRARVTVLGEGPRGTLAKRLLRPLPSEGALNPQVYSIGIKETWQLPAGRLEPGTVMHTLGYPLGQKIFGGGFLYARSGDIMDAGLVVGLEYEDPRTEPHRLFGEWKRHPVVAKLLSGAKLLGYGAKAIPEGGLFSQPQMAHDGAVIIGDSAGFLNSQRLKGIHLAMKSGMLAAEAILEALVAGDFSRASLERYPALYRQSWAWKELWGVRNFHQGFHSGLFAGALHGGLQMLTGGRGLWARYPIAPGHERMKKLSGLEGAPAGDSGGGHDAGVSGDRTHAGASGGTAAPGSQAAPPDNVIVLDRVTDVYHSGTAHDEDQPCHLKVSDFDVCQERCTREYGNPCQFFCPAAVYEIVPGAKGNLPFINFSNCVHCKTCDIMDPYQIIDWVTPQGGDGPGYRGM